MPLLEAKNIYKTFINQGTPHQVLKGISLSLHEGEVLAITGSSGNGKTTLLNILGTLDMPSSGELLFFDKAFSSKEYPLIRNKYLGFVFQHFHLLENETVETNILMPAIIAGITPKRNPDIIKRAEFLAEKVGLKNKLKIKSALLSGGEKQRVAIARALINDPKILLADEPSGNLDDQTSSSIHNLLLGLATEGKGIILVTHNSRLVEKCSRQCVLKNGSFS
ncbi:ABC transporter ATP-binding protein [Chlamydiifrater phoenicopteri]|uniref:ABC transporter ATP-binding protein n=1 Tax=Chlamydiifrater phoenicopteri TaxID=2681469 RepID=UPI001BCBB9D4|nr:ABC transporter ATP-binding protein [Chlamydiifrater phoenicopteri]